MKDYRVGSVFPEEEEKPKQKTEEVWKTISSILEKDMGDALSRMISAGGATTIPTSTLSSWGISTAKDPFLSYVVRSVTS